MTTDPLTPEHLAALRSAAQRGSLIAWSEILALLDEVERLRKAENNFLTFGQGGASYLESQELDRMCREDGTEGTP